MAPWRPHLEAINQSYNCGGGGDVVFDQFSMLSAELRLLIWHCALEEFRLLEVMVEGEWAPLPEVEGAVSPSRDGPPLYSTTNALNKLVSGRNYTVNVQGFPLYSKLLRVNRESRQAALEFYRLHIPCYFRRTDAYSKRAVRATLYFNPEYDIWHLDADGPAAHFTEHVFVDFLYDFKAYDPRGIGLLNLALASDAMIQLHSLANISEPRGKATLVDFLSQLREIIWIAHPHAGRSIVEMWDGAFVGIGFRFNHSMPGMGITPRFSLLGRDLRPIGPELKCVVTTCSNSRQMRILWRDPLERLEIRQAQPARERVLFAYRMPRYEELLVDDIKTADDFLGREEESWLRSQERTGCHYHRVEYLTGKPPPIEGPEELAKAVRPALGFWLFPVEALGSLESVDMSGSGKRVFDMSDHWSELALSTLY